MIIGYTFEGDGQLIAYDETMAGLHPELLSAENPAVAAVLVSRARSVAQQRTVAFANTMRERIASSKHYLQAARWSIQLASAQAVKAGVPTEFDTSVLEREARLRDLGETVEQLSDKVLANSLIFASVGAAVDGIERATLDRVAACSELGEFEVILTEAKATALVEFMDIFTPFYGIEGAEARAAQFFGA